MLCNTCQQKSDCIPAALAANDSYLYKLLERLKKCDRFSPEKQQSPETRSTAQPKQLFPHPST
jgi:hypothetical protein